MKKMIVILCALLLFSSIPVYANVEKEGRLWQDESVYSLMIDRFENGDISNDGDVNSKDPFAYNGGDLQGVINRLEYIKNMGFTAIRLSPIFDNAPGGYHGYWVTDFYKVDEHFGTIKTFQKLVKEAHKKKLKVIIDFPLNNVAISHPWVNDPGKQDWFHEKRDVADAANQLERENGWVDGMPDLNQDNPEVSKYLVDAAKWWIKKTGIDGYSLPEANYVPLSFWSDFSDEVKKEKTDFLLMGVPTDNTPFDEGEYQKAGIDSFFNYAHSGNLRKVFATTNQSFQSLYSDSESGEKDFLKANFFDNEYTVRFTNDIVEKRQFPGARWKTALTYLYTTPGIPVFYYGTEIAVVGGEIPDNRRQMNFRTEKELIDYMTNLSRLRNELPSLTRGTIEMLYDQGGMAVYKRVYKGETAVIAINNSTESQKVTLTAQQLEDNKELRGLLAGDLVRSKDGMYHVIIDRDNSEIYVLTEKSGLNMAYIAGLTISLLLMLLFLILIIKRGKREIVD